MRAGLRERLRRRCITSFKLSQDLLGRTMGPALQSQGLEFRSQTSYLSSPILVIISICEPHGVICWGYPLGDR